MFLAKLTAHNKAKFSYDDIKRFLLQLYLNDERPWLLGFSGGKDWKETNRLRELQEEIASEKGIRAYTLRRL